MTPARLSDETLREWQQWCQDWANALEPLATFEWKALDGLRDMARELLTLRARVADTPENVEIIAQAFWNAGKVWAERICYDWDDPSPFLNPERDEYREAARAALAALRGD
jgi:uncharacterized protein (DUF885 family)